MKRKICTWVITAAAVLSFAVPASAAVTQKTVHPAYRYTDKNGDGICDYFTDKNGDGICDNYASRGRRAGCGRGCGRGRF